MAVEPEDLYLRSQASKDTSPDAEDLYLRSQASKEAAGGDAAIPAIMAHRVRRFRSAHFRFRRGPN